jgi:hypothetical protein
MTKSRKTTAAKTAAQPAGKDKHYLGEHKAIIEPQLWDAVQARLAANAVERSNGGRAKSPSLLAGLLFDADGNRMTPTHAVKKGRRYRYYVFPPADHASPRRVTRRAAGPGPGDRAARRQSNLPVSL